MNAESYLRKQGWKGSGHSLDSTGRGIKKPLLIAHKQDQLGLGKKKAAWTTDDQWWMRVYDQSLQTIGTGQESTLNQIRTKGVNRGGLYGFFVKGEAIAGTIDDSSATDASIPPSGASTPPTSASDSEAPTKAVKMSDRKSKRKREDEVAPKEVKKAKKNGFKVDKNEKASATAPSSKDQTAVTRKIAKLSPKKKASYEKRAAEKKQTLNDYILRRIQKKSAKRANRYDKTAPPAPFFTDLEGDATMVNNATTVTPSKPVLGLVRDTPLETEVPKPTTDIALPALPAIASVETAPKKKASEKAPSTPTKKVHGGRDAVREKREMKMEEKKADKAEKRSKKSMSKFGKSKDKSRRATAKVGKENIVAE